MNIVYFFHCASCLPQKPIDLSPEDYQVTNIGLTSDGAIQVWCRRCDIEVCLIKDLKELAAVILQTGCKRHPHN